jgi:alpha-tubulin suppressor-like RCC1 family protein
MNLKTYFSSPANFSVFLTQDEKLMVWGEDYRGSLGLGGLGSLDTPTHLDLSKLLKKGEKIIDASCGAYHTLLLTSDHRVVVWGRNDAGQLGLGHCTDVSVPVLLDLGFLPSEERIEKVRCG